MAKQVHSIAKNSGIRGLSPWNLKQTLRGSWPTWLQLTNHAEAPCRPQAAKNTAPGNGCLNIRNITSVTLCMCVYVFVCLLAHVPA